MTSWPGLIAAEPGLTGAGIFLFSYQTSFFSGSYSIGDAVDALRDELRLGGVLQLEQLIFVCHSMGGIVARSYLVRQAADLAARHIEAGLFLVASPSVGADYASWLKPLAALMRHSQGKALALIRQNPWLSDLDRDFINLKESRRLPLRGKELVEDRFYVFSWFMRRVVPPFSGIKYFGDGIKIPGTDHSTIARPASAGALQHRLLVDFVLTGSAARLTAPPSQVPADGPVAPEEAVSHADRYLPSLLQPFAGSASLEAEVRKVLDDDEFPTMMSHGSGALVPNPVWGLEAAGLPLLGPRVRDAIRGQMFLAVADLPSGKPGIYCYWSERWQSYLFPFRKDDERSDEMRAGKIIQHSRDRYFCDAVELGKRVISVKRNQEHLTEMWLYCFEFFSITMGDGFNGRANHCWVDLDRLSDTRHREARVNGDIIRAIRRHFSAGLHGLPRSSIDWSVARFDGELPPKP